MRSLTIIWICLYAQTCLATAQDSSVRSARVLVIPDSLNQSSKVQGISLGPYLEYLEDSTQSLTIDDLSISSVFLPLDQMEYDRNKVYWFRLRLDGSQTSEYEYYLRFNTLIRIDLYERNRTHDFILKRTGPYLKPKEKDVLLGQRALIGISILQNPDTVYLKAYPTTFEVEYFNTLLYSGKPIDELIKWRATKNTIFLAVGLCMILYNLLLYFFNRERIYVYYILMVAFLCVFLASDYFFAYIFNRLDYPRWMLIAMNLAGLFLILFFDQYLKLNESRRKTHYMLIGIATISGLLTLPFAASLWGLKTNAFHWEILSISWTMLVVTSAFFVSVGAYRRGYSQAKFFLWANLIFIITSFAALSLDLLGAKLKWIHYDHLTTREWVFGLGGIGMMSQVILYGLAIGHKMLVLEKDKSKAVKDKLETQQTINTQLDEKVTERTSQLQQRNKENELLLGEIHHRVKNNLQVISSLLKLQSRQLEEGQAKSAVLEGRDRVKAMALIHQRLYQQDQFSSIRMDDYVKNLVENLANSYGFRKQDFILELNIESIYLDVDSAVPLGLIINELVSNSFKHAFKKDNSNRLEISLKEADSMLQLTIEDNGSGIPSDFKIEKASSFGLQLIHALTAELGGTIQFKNGQGTRVVILIKEYKTMETE